MSKERSLLIIGLLVCCALGGGFVGHAGSMVLSEIAWAGTAASANDEWIEIQNRSDADVALAGWEVRFAGVRILLGEVGESTVQARTSVLPAGEFLLLERTDDTTIADIDADVIYKGVLPNTGVRVELVDPSGVVVDWVDPVEGQWPAGGTGSYATPYATMERTPAGEWVSNNGVLRNGVDANGDPINGTPKRTNSAEIIALQAPSIRLVHPSEEALVLEGVALISWIATDPDGADSALSISLFVSTDHGMTWQTLVVNLVNTGSYAWDTRDRPIGDPHTLRITATDIDGHTASAVSPVFTVKRT